MKNLNQPRCWCRDTFHHYVVYKEPSIFFILGLILSYKLVEKTFLDILITHLADVWKNYDLRRANAVVNLREGTSAILLPLVAYVADVHTGRFIMMFFSSAVCIIGLLLSWLAARHDEQLELGLFYPALGLITLAQATQTITLQAFLEDQLRSTSDDVIARRRHSQFWWTCVSFVAGIIAQFGLLPELKLRDLAIVLIAVMGVSFLVFLLGTKCYTYVDRIQNPFSDVGTVILGVIARKNDAYPQTQAGYNLPTPDPRLFYSDPSGGDLQIQPHVPWLRWLDKAAIVKELARPSPSVAQVRGVKFLLKMLPLWFCFLTFSLVFASGSTFFLEEATYLAPGDDLQPILLLTNLQRLTLFVVSETSSYVVRKLTERKQNYNKLKMELVPMGIGMSCCVACCIAAWATAVCRQHDIDRNMSVYWLAPQFMLLGLMGGLTQEELESFYESQVPQSLSTYGPPFGEFIMGIGQFVSIICILILSTRRFNWFAIDLEHSRLDKYYILLAVLSFWNFIIYCLVARWYGDETFLLKDAVEGEVPVAHTLEDDALVSRSIEGQHGSRRPLFQRTVSKLKADSGDIVTVSASSSGSREDSNEEERGEEPLLATKENSAYNSLMQLRMVRMSLSLFNRAGGRN